jgi:hypothetical protein
MYDIKDHLYSTRQVTKYLGADTRSNHDEGEATFAQKAERDQKGREANELKEFEMARAIGAHMRVVEPGEINHTDPRSMEVLESQSALPFPASLTVRPSWSMNRINWNCR